MINTELPNILVVDSSEINLELLSGTFIKHELSCNFELCNSIPTLLDRLSNTTWDSIFLYIDQVPIEIDALHESLPKNNAKIPIVVLTKNYHRDTALSYIRRGASNVFSTVEIEDLLNYTKKSLSQNKINLVIKKQRQVIEDAHKRFVNLSNQMPVAIAFIHDGAFININQAFQNFFNLSNADEVSEISFLDLIDYADIEKTKHALQEFTNNNKPNTNISSVNVKKDAENLCKVNLLVSKTNFNSENGLLVIFQPCDWNIKPATPKIDHKQFLSSESFIQSLNQTIRNKDYKRAHSLCFFELDAYSRIKKNMGITRSDQLLHEISDFIQSYASIKTKISRLNSDVYTLLISRESTRECEAFFADLQSSFSSHVFSASESAINVAANIGIVHISDTIITPDQALSLADVACTVSRNRKKNQYHIYNPEQDRSTVERIDQSWVDKIKDAIKNDNFKLLFQPIVNISSNEELFYEALLRIKSSGDEDVLPNQFLHFAKQSNLDGEIDKWVIEESIDLLSRNENSNLKFFINLSETSLKDIGFLNWLTKQNKIIDRFVFEIPEHFAIKWASETIHFIQEIHQFKGKVCIDHYGNHPESNSQIESLNADYLKIDGAFINNLSTNRKHQSIIHKICLDSKTRSTKIIANYVQDADSLAILWREGIDYVQGNYLQGAAPHLKYKFESQI